MDAVGDEVSALQAGETGGARLIVTLDGPAASGKSSAARQVAQALGIPFVSSGLLYRAATYLTLAHEIEPTDEGAVLALLEEQGVELVAEMRAPNRVLVNGEDVSAQLHTASVDATVSAVARHPGVRSWVNARLKEVRGSFVVEGRDMGAAVFPEAAYKFYLSAPAEVRAARRAHERGTRVQEIADALSARDAKDARQLVPAPDAVHLGTADLSLEQVVAAILSRVQVRT